MPKQGESDLHDVAWWQQEQAWSLLRHSMAAAKKRQAAMLKTLFVRALSTTQSSSSLQMPSILKDHATKKHVHLSLQMSSILKDHHGTQANGSYIAILRRKLLRDGNFF